MSQVQPTPSPLQDFLKRRAWFLLLAVLIFFAGIRWRLREMPLERDEGEYAYAGQLIRQGIPPYTEAYNMKLPGTYAAYAVMMAILGQTPAGIHTSILLVNSVSIILIFLLSRKLLDEVAALGSALAFGLLAASPSVLGLVGHATHFVALTALAGTYFFLEALDAGKTSDDPDTSRGALGSRRCAVDFVLAGFFFGLCFLMKQHGIFFGVFGGIGLLLSRFRAQGNRVKPPTRSVLVEFTLFVFAFLSTYGLTCFWLWRAHAFDRFIFWTISYARSYVSAIPVSLAPKIFVTALLEVAAPQTILWSLAIAGAVALVWERRLSGIRKLVVIGFSIASFASLCPGFLFRDHYFIAFMPALAILVGMALSWGIRLTQAASKTRLAGWSLVILFFAGLLQGFAENRDVFFELPAADASVRHYHSTSFIGAKQVGDYLRSKVPIDSRIAVIGSEPEIYFYAKRRSATGYLYMYPLVETHADALRMQQQMVSEIESNQPAFVVYVNDDLSWLTHTAAPRLLLDWWKSYWRSNLVPESVIYIKETSDLHETPHQAFNASKDPKGFMILRRKTFPDPRPDQTSP